jgi:hypothetical protein
MKRILLTLSLLAAATVVWGQNTQEAAAAAAAALSAAEDVPVKEEKPQYWTTSLTSSINFGQTYLSQWAAGGYNNYSLSGNADLSIKYAKEKMSGNTRLQLEYGMLYSADKPILQKTKDRIYFESKWGYQTSVKNVAYSAGLDFKSQFSDTYNYVTPSDALMEKYADTPSKAWREAAKNNLKSGFFSPAYLNLGVGAQWTPAPWFTLNLAPLSGGGVAVSIPALRKIYGMDLRKEGLDPDLGESYRSFRFEFGAYLKLDMAWVINDVFSYATQFTAFYNYLTPKVEPRMTWDNKITWKIAKFFSIQLSTNLIYDPRVWVRDVDKDGVADHKGVQFKEYFEFGFTYTLNHKH